MSDPYYQIKWDQHLDTSLDSALTPLLNKGMSWLPWIGRDFCKSSRRILLVGESNYADGADAAKVAAKKIERQSENLYQREVIAEYPLVGREAGWETNTRRTFDNLHRALTGSALSDPEDIEKRARFWNHVAYHNIVQRVLDYPSGDRPSFEDFCRGWRTLIPLIEVIRPVTCIFVGVQASDSFNHAMGELGVQHAPIQRGDMLNRAYTRVGGSVTVGGNTTALVFMKHTAKFFSWRLWNNYLESAVADDVAHLRNRIVC